MRFPGRTPPAMVVTLAYDFDLIAPMNIDFFGTTTRPAHRPCRFERESVFAISDFAIDQCRLRDDAVVPVTQHRDLAVRRSPSSRWCLPIFLVLLFGVIEGGRFIFHYEVLNNATREGVRYAIIHGENSADPIGPGDEAVMESVITDATFALLGQIDCVTLVYSGPNGETNKRGSNVAVGATFTYAPLMPVLPTISIRAESNGVSTTSRAVERGQVLAIFALSAVILIIVAALAFDGGMVLLERRDQQDAADAAALAGARFLPTDTARRQSPSHRDRRSNGFEDGVDSATVDIVIGSWSSGGVFVPEAATERSRCRSGPPARSICAGIIGRSCMAVWPHEP